MSDERVSPPCEHGRPDGVRCSVCAGDVLPDPCLSTYRGHGCRNELGTGHDGDHFNGDLRWPSHTSTVDVARFTTSDLREAFVAGFRASTDCGYDGASFAEVAPGDRYPDQYVLRAEVEADFDRWRSGEWRADPRSRWADNR